MADPSAGEVGGIFAGAGPRGIHEIVQRPASDEADTD